MAVVDIEVNAFIMQRRAFSIMGNTITELTLKKFFKTFFVIFWIGGKMRKEGSGSC